MSKWTETIDRYLREGRTVSGGKGADTANAQRQQELAMQQQAFNEQMKQLNLLNANFSKYLSGNIGFSPQAMAGMRSQFLNSNNSTFNQAGQQVREALGARGNTGTNPVGGDFTQGLSSLLGAKAQSQSGGLLNLDVQNQMQALQNTFNAGNLLSGNAAVLTGTQGVAGNAATGALDAYIKAKNTGFASSFSNAFGGALGKTLGTFGGQSGPGGTSYSFGG